MLDKIPAPEEMTALVGKQAARRGNMSINTAGAVKRCAHYTQERTAWGLWLSWGRTSG